MPEASVPQPVSRSEFARLCGVSPAAITKALSGCLAPAAYGKQVDLASPAAVAYRSAKEDGPRVRVGGTKKKEPTKKQASSKKPAKPKKKPVKKKVAKEEPAKRVPRGREAAKYKALEGPPPKAIDHIPRDLRQWDSMPMGEFVEKFGSDGRLKNWVYGMERIQKIQAERLKIARQEGELVSRDLVMDSFIAPIEEFHRKLLTDFVKTVINRLMAKINAGATKEECEAEARKQLQRFMKPMKEKLKRGVRNA